MPIASESDLEEKLKLIEIVREAIQMDNNLREKYQIVDKFRFVRDRLAGLLKLLEESLPTGAQHTDDSMRGMAEGEVLVYVYLYNAQGLQFRTWQNLVNPKVFYEYSVNRPIYAEKSYIETLLRTKTNKAQHAYLTIAVKPEFVFKAPEESAPRDIAGNPVIKVKEGSLHINKVISFMHLEQEYVLNADGELIKK